MLAKARPLPPGKGELLFELVVAAPQRKHSNAPNKLAVPRRKT